jgi:hypothetical protein
MLKTLITRKIQSERITIRTLALLRTIKIGWKKEIILTGKTLKVVKKIIVSDNSFKILVLTGYNS